MLTLALAGLLQASPSEAPARLRPLMGVPYVVDAGEDEAGRCVRFATGRTLEGPGLNCSGFVVAACRRLLGFGGSLAEATRDRRGDSGPGAPWGQDWDFGLDLILNLSEGHHRSLLDLEGRHPVPDQDGRTLRGFRLGTPGLWERLLPQLDPKVIVLGSLSRWKSGRLAHHHVAVLLKDSAGRSWFYHTLPGGCVHRISLDTPAGRTRLLQMFGPSQHLLLLAVEP